MMRPDQGASFTVLRMFYIQAIRSIIQYAAPCITIAKDTNIAGLEVIQNKALRLILWTPPWTRAYPANGPSSSYVHNPPPWQEVALSTIIHKLSDAKHRLSPEALRQEATEALKAAPRQDACEFFTDGSVDMRNGKAAAAFVSNTGATRYRLQDGASILQAELVAIEGALLRGHTPAVIHTDSLAALQTLQQKQVRDNVGLVTSIWVTAQEMERREASQSASGYPATSTSAGTKRQTKKQNMHSGSLK
ncbi:hypothetical protein O3P69_012125 [Scylla paramamosain]|uniref:RNase H type-1 domain-containing protein n=1 Tax=Scylla paramamosain TaxID=85552 RepID=A0AAW0TEX8_SCYPA